MILAVQIVSVIGFLLSLYSYYVEKKIKKNHHYKALCDISSKINCSQIARSKYSHMIDGISNSLLGMLSYVLVFAMAFYSITYVLYLSMAALIASVYLGYVQYFKIKKVCIVCSLIYAVNILLFIFSYKMI